MVKIVGVRCSYRRFFIHNTELSETSSKKAQVAPNLRFLERRKTLYCTESKRYAGAVGTEAWAGRFDKGRRAQPRSFFRGDVPVDRG